MTDLTVIGTAIILSGFMLVILAMISSARSSENGERQTQAKGGGVIMVGPIPIIFGSDAKWTSIAIALAIALIVIVFLSGVSMR
ncbi:MAG: DUF131 domain-containing protein [Thaumarchaeota archaeon]|jgi:uncharacterized protein (TIGR00304 family)|nr:DUF131 domain-containing protein [Nitrososphaerota archaeon]